jgi:hypothetical protein
MFLSANNFFYRVDRHGDQITRTGRWRDQGRPEARLVGIQYVDWYQERYKNQPYTVTGAARVPWAFPRVDPLRRLPHDLAVELVELRESAPRWRRTWFVSDQQLIDHRVVRWHRALPHALVLADRSSFRRSCRSGLGLAGCGILVVAHETRFPRSERRGRPPGTLGRFPRARRSPLLAAYACLRASDRRFLPHVRPANQTGYA